LKKDDAIKKAKTMQFKTTEFKIKRPKELDIIDDECEVNDKNKYCLSIAISPQRKRSSLLRHRRSLNMHQLIEPDIHQVKSKSIDIGELDTHYVRESIKFIENMLGERGINPKFIDENGNHRTPRKKLRLKVKSHTMKVTSSPKKTIEVRQVVKRDFSRLPKSLTKSMVDRRKVVPEGYENIKPSKTNTTDFFSDCNDVAVEIEMRKKANRFCRLAEQGGSESLREFKREFRNDPRTYFLINSAGQNMRTPLNVACKNGKIEIVKYLMRKGSDPHVPSYISKRQPENVLEACIRGSAQSDIIEYLLEQADWSKEELRAAMKIKGISSSQKKIIKKYYLAYYGDFFTRCFLCIC